MYDESLPKAAMNDIALVVGRFMNKPMTLALVREFQSAIYDVTVRTRQRGFKDFPDLVVVYLENRGKMYVVRKDLDPAGIQRTIKTIVRDFPMIFPFEVINAIRRAFPHYHPDDTGQTSVDTEQRIRDKAARDLTLKQPALRRLSGQSA